MLGTRENARGKAESRRTAACRRNACFHTSNVDLTLVCGPELWEAGGKASTPSERLFGAGHSAWVIVFRLRAKPRSLALFS